MSGGVEVRRAEIADAEAISRVVLLALRETNAADCPPEVIEAVAASFSPEEVRSRFASRAVFVATLDGRVVGTASLDGETLRTVFVDPERQAQGMGRALVRAVGDLARARGIATLAVPSSITAEGFYRKLGFAPVRDEFHGSERTIVMEKRLRTNP